jgi:hypothetical protein
MGGGINIGAAATVSQIVNQALMLLRGLALPREVGSQFLVLKLSQKYTVGAIQLSTRSY